MKPLFTSGENKKKWMIAAGIVVALAGCGNEEENANNYEEADASSIQQSQQNGESTKKDTNDVVLTNPEEEPVDEELLASAQKKMDEGREDELTIDEEIALSTAMTTTTNQEDQLAEQGTSKQELLTSGAAKLRSGQEISEAEEKVVADYASMNEDSELLTALQKFRHEKNNFKHDKKQITQNVGYGDTYERFKKTHGDGEDSIFSAVHMPEDYYVDDMSINLLEQTMNNASKQMEFDEEKTKKYIEQYLPKDAKFLEFLEAVEDDSGNFTGKVDSDASGKYPVINIKHQFKFESKDSAKRLNNDGKITVNVITTNYDKDGKTQEEAKYLDTINIVASHPRMHMQ